MTNVERGFPPPCIWGGGVHSPLVYLCCEEGHNEVASCHGARIWCERPMEFVGSGAMATLTLKNSSLSLLGLVPENYGKNHPIQNLCCRKGRPSLQVFAGGNVEKESTNGVLRRVEEKKVDSSNANSSSASQILSFLCPLLKLLGVSFCTFCTSSADLTRRKLVHTNRTLRLMLGTMHKKISIWLSIGVF